MNWQEIRHQYPKRWLLLEAIGAYSGGDQRIIPQLKVIEIFADDWHEVWEAYKPCILQIVSANSISCTQTVKN